MVQKEWYQALSERKGTEWDQKSGLFEFSDKRRMPDTHGACYGIRKIKLFIYFKPFIALRFLISIVTLSLDLLYEIYFRVVVFLEFKDLTCL